MSTIRQAIEHLQDCNNKLHGARLVVEALVAPIFEKMEHQTGKQYKIIDCSFYGDNFHITYENWCNGQDYGDTITIPARIIDAEDPLIAMDKYLLERKLESKRNQLQRYMNDLDSLNKAIEEIKKNIR